MPAAFSVQTFSALISCFGQLGSDLPMNKYGDTSLLDGMLPDFLEDTISNGQAVVKMRKGMSRTTLPNAMANKNAAKLAESLQDQKTRAKQDSRLK